MKSFMKWLMPLFTIAEFGAYIVTHQLEFLVWCLFFQNMWILEKVEPALGTR